ncbi:hypothetical protein BH24BAC1_BH24BAC1_17820 [soil metagenome]
MQKLLFICLTLTLSLGVTGRVVAQAPATSAPPQTRGAKATVTHYRTFQHNFLIAAQEAEPFPIFFAIRRLADHLPPGSLHLLQKPTSFK